jgi:hypothetical protein
MRVILKKQSNFNVLSLKSSGTYSKMPVSKEVRH